MIRDFKFKYFFVLLFCITEAGLALPNSWDIISNTGNYSNIGFASSESYRINGRAFASGDAIGVFYTRNGEQFCAGYLEWGEQLGISVWGDDSQTLQKDGFITNEVYNFKLWDNALQEEIINPAITLFSGNEFYTENGLTIVSSLIGQSLIPLSEPILTAPANDATLQAIVPTLAWESVPTAESYRLQISTSESFIAPFYNNSVNTTSTAITELNNGTTYHWRVKAVRGTTESAWSQVFDFTTIPSLPESPTLVAPANLATLIAVDPTLSWDIVAGIDSFLVQVSTSSTFSSFIADEVVYTTSKGLTNLQFDTQYFWRVRSIKSSNLMSNWSDARSFSTISEPSSTSTILNIGVLLQGAWANNIHKEIAVTIELRRNNIGTSSLNSSVLYRRIPVFINSDGIANANFADLVTGDYWIVVRASGYLAIASKLKQYIQSASIVNYDFTNTTNYVYNPSMLKLSNGRYLMRIGDLDNSRIIGSDDFGILKNNGSANSTVPNL